MGRNEGYLHLGISRVENRRKGITGRGNSLCKASGVKDGLLDGRRKLSVARSYNVAYYRMPSHPSAVAVVKDRLKLP